MNDQTNGPTSGPSGQPPHPGGSRHYGRRVRFGIAAAMLVGVGVVTGALGTVAVNAVAGGGWHGHHGHRHAFSLEEAKDKAQNKVAWLAGMIDATDEQRDALSEIADRLADDVYPMVETHRTNKRAFIETMLRTEFNREALMQLRADEMALIDAASLDVVEALADAAEVLTPEQRKQLASFGRFRRHGGEEAAQ